MDIGEVESVFQRLERAIKKYTDLKEEKEGDGVIYHYKSSQFRGNNSKLKAHSDVEDGKKSDSIYKRKDLRNLRDSKLKLMQIQDDIKQEKDASSLYSGKDILLRGGQHRSEGMDKREDAIKEALYCLNSVIVNIEKLLEC